MQRITIDLVKEPEIKDLLATKQPGDLIDLHCSIQALDDQTATLTIDEAEEGKEPEETEDGDGGGPEGDTANNPDAGAGGDGGLSPAASGTDLTGMEQAAT